jgi:membrane fusion protein (multidrug efflux system)
MAEALRKPAPPAVPPATDEAPDGPRPLPRPATPPEKRAKQEIAGRDGSWRRRRKWTRGLLFALLPFALLAGFYWYVTGGAVMSTDDAYVDAEKVGISTDVAGIVKDVDVVENQHVTAGQVLYRLDPRQFQIAVNDAKANLGETALTVASMKRDYARMQSDIAAQDAQVTLDQTNFDRDVMLLRTKTIAQAVYDQGKSVLDADKSKLEALRQQAQVQLAKLGGDPDLPLDQQPQYLKAKAQLDEAQRQLDHSVVTAPFSGIVTNVSTIARGKYLAASTAAFYLVDNDHVWVEAQPKETELTYVRVGQPVTVTVDTYPDRQWHGVVESVSPAASQEFALLPAQNTSGNWVKVVQRLPMRVRLDTSDKSMPPLAAGMSAEVDVDTGHPRGLPRFLSSLSSLLPRSLASRL